MSEKDDDRGAGEAVMGIPTTLAGHSAVPSMRRAVPSMRSTAYVNRQTAHKLLLDTVREMRRKATKNRVMGFDGDAYDLDSWADAIESVTNLTLGG